MATINKQMSIGEVLEIDRTTAPIMMEYGMHCMGCTMASGENVEEACAAHGVNVDLFVEKVNEFIVASSQA